MPNRIIKESVCTSDNVNDLSWFEECFFYRLIVNCDDYGRTDARSAILKARLFPLKTVTEKQIESALDKLATVGIVSVYEYDGRPYLQFLTWEKHQTIRNKKSKYPQPDETCKQLNANVPVIQSNPNPIQNPNPILHGDESPSRSPIITLTLNDKTEYEIYKIDEWKELYPGIDVMQQLRNMKGWLNANPKQRKTESGILRFINGWLSKEQNRSKSANPQKQNPQHQFMHHENYAEQCEAAIRQSEEEARLFREEAKKKVKSGEVKPISNILELGERLREFGR